MFGAVSCIQAVRKGCSWLCAGDGAACRSPVPHTPLQRHWSTLQRSTLDASAPSRSGSVSAPGSSLCMHASSWVPPWRLTVCVLSSGNCVSRTGPLCSCQLRRHGLPRAAQTCINTSQATHWPHSAFQRQAAPPWKPLLYCR